MCDVVSAKCNQVQSICEWLLLKNQVYIDQEKVKPKKPKKNPLFLFLPNLENNMKGCGKEDQNIGAMNVKNGSDTSRQVMMNGRPVKRPRS